MIENNIDHSDSDGLKEWFGDVLTKSGIPKDLAIKLGWKPVGKSYINLCLSFAPQCGNQPVEGFEIPYLAADGQALETPGGEPYLRIRLHYAAEITDDKDDKIKAAKYLSPKGAGIQPYILPGVYDWLIGNPNAPMIVTEGEKKAVSAFVKGLAIVGIPGIWCWSDGEKNLHPLIADYLKGRNEVVLIFDSDALNPKKKPEFDRCAEYLANALIPFNCTLKVWVVPGDKAEDKVGLDDWLVAGGTPELARELIAKDAVTVFPRPRVDVNPGRIIPVAELIGQSAARRGVLFRFTPNVSSMGGEAVCNPEDKGSICLLNPTEGVSLFEEIVSPFKQTPKGPVDAVFADSKIRQITSTPAFLRQLSPIVSLSHCPVLVMSKGKLRTITGHDLESGIWASGSVNEPESLAEAVSILFSVDAETMFASEGDRSRAMAHILSPAFAMSGILPCASPILAIEGNDSQAGKGKKSKRTAAIYNAVPVIVNQPGGSIGSIEEGLDAAYISGAEIISLDNMEQQGQKPFSSPKICSALTETVYTARAAYSKNVQLDPRRRIIMLTSNGIILLKDILNRCCLVMLLKQNDRRFKEYPEGSQEDHIRANYPVYLGAVFRVIREWHSRGCPQSSISVSTGFERWWRVMDWLVVNIFQLASVIDGYKEISTRITDPELSWLRNVINAAVEAGKADQALQITELLEVMIEARLDLPGCTGVYSIEQLTEDKQKTLIMIIGQRVGRLFRKHGKQDEIVITPWRIIRTEELRTYSAGSKEIKLYTISQLPTVSGDMIMKDIIQQSESPLPVITESVCNDQVLTSPPEVTGDIAKCPVPPATVTRNVVNFKPFPSLPPGMSGKVVNVNPVPPPAIDSIRESCHRQSRVPSTATEDIRESCQLSRTATESVRE